MKSNKLYKEIWNNGTGKVRRSLETIRKVCDDLEKNNRKIYVTRVGDECGDKYGSPKLQSIRNNRKLIEYIQKREDEQNLLPKETQITGNEELVRVIEELRRENKCLKALLRSKNLFSKG